MQNLDKPSVGIPQTELNVGSGFNLVVGSTFKLIVGSLNTLFAMTNVSKVSIGETWGTIASTWGNETRDWQSVSQLITNATKQSSSMTNFAKP